MAIAASTTTDLGDDVVPKLDWRAAFDASPVASLIFTPELVLMHCNRAHSVASGVPAEALRGRFMFDVFPKNPAAESPDTEAIIRDSISRAMSTGATDEPPVQQHDLPRADGGFERRYWRIMHTPVVQDGAVTAIRQDSWDVTASVLADERQRTLQRVAGTLAGLAFWELDAPADRISRTPELDRLFGFPAPEGAHADRPFSDYAARFHPDDRPLVEGAVAELMAEGPGAVRELGYRVVRPGGEIRHALVRGEAITGEGGRRLLAGITFDVTDLIAREARLAGLLAEKEALLGEINHRVKNSLQLVSAILSLEARRAGPEGAGRLRSAASRVQSVASVHAALYQGGDLGSVDMGAHLRSFCARLADGFGAAARGIALVVDAEEVPVSADRAVPLSLIVHELVANAFRHAAFDPEAGGKVIVTLGRAPSGRVVLSVADTGPAGGGDPASPSGAASGIPGSTRETASETGLGSRLIEALVRQIGGSHSWERDQGWKTRIEFDDREGAAIRSGS
jgi:two-component sensor histidine kinase